MEQPESAANTRLAVSVDSDDEQQSFGSGAGRASSSSSRCCGRSSSSGSPAYVARNQYIYESGQPANYFRIFEKPREKSNFVLK